MAPFSRASFLLVSLVLAGAPLCAAGERSFDLGLRFNLLVGDGEPTNDILGGGVVGHLGLGDRWSLGVAVDHSAEFDVEHTPRLAGIVQDPNLEVIDSKGSSTGLRVWLERRYGPRDGGRTQLFWGVGAGLDSISVDDVTGRTAAGRPFLLEVDAGIEPVLVTLAGARWHLGESFFLETTLRAEQHFADWTITDRRSTARGTVDDYLITGVSAGFGWRW